MSSTFLPLGITHNAVYGLQLTPVYISLNRHVENIGTSRGITVAERSARIRANPARAAAIAAGRERLAKVVAHFNPGVRLLSSLRLAAGLSQAELAEKMDMKQPNIARFEKKPGDPSMSTLVKLASVLGVDIAEVIAVVEATNTGAKSHG